MIKLNDSLMDKQNKKERADRRLSLCLIWLIAIIAIIFFLNNFVYLNVKVDGISMEGTLYDGDVLSVNKLKTAKYGNIIVIKEDSGKLIIKRLIGKAGDTIELIDGKVYRTDKDGNGNFITENYLKDGTETLPTDRFGTYKWVVPEGEIFYLGDNREFSADSRYYGTVSEEDVIGVVEVWSIGLKDVRQSIYSAFEDIAKLFGSNGCVNKAGEQ